MGGEPRVAVVPGRDEKVAELRGIFPDGARVCGVDFDASFARLAFGDQLARVAALTDQAERQRALLVARSFGAWLLLNALIDRAERVRVPVVLLAPVLGYGSGAGVGLIAPRAARFWRSVADGLPMPAQRISLLAAPDDGQCPLELQQRLERCWPIERCEIPGAAHGVGLRTALEESRARVKIALAGCA